MEEVTTCYTCEHCGATFKRQSFYQRHVKSKVCTTPPDNAFEYRLNGQEPPRRHECQFCGNTFSTERGFNKHRCDAMKRHELMDTPDGRYAFRLYQQWFALYRHRRPTEDSFLKSRYFYPFMKLVEQIRRLDLPCVGYFLRCMKQYDTDPTIWTHPDVYSAYIKLLDSRDIGDLLNDTVDEIEELVEAGGYASPVEWLSTVPPRMILHLADQRRISIKVLCFADVFINYLDIHKDDTEAINLIMSKVPSHWLRNFMHDYPELVDAVTERINEFFTHPE